ncbi:MAG TPA: serine/threonine-protein kinase, partial [Nannocystaceae bacterium]|nr:serine/threonine-protein kinase [Nannocystaceae bacterium]
GLAAAHARGLVHRDFKPENALIGDDNERVRVVDFGVVGDAESHSTFDAEVPVDSSDDALRTRTGEFLGTPRYMAPEQFANVRVGPPADQFAWCVALYEALSHERPFPGATISELATAVSESPPKPLPAGPYPRALAAVLSRGFSRDPADRYASMDELIAAIEAATIPRRARLPWIAGATAIAIGAAAVAIRLAQPAEVAKLAVVAAPPTIVATPPVRLTGAPSDMQEHAQADFAAGHAAMERGEPDVAARSFDAAAGQFERVQADGEDIARIQLDRALAHLALWQRAGTPDDLAIAHELLLRTANDEYRHPQPEPLQARATAALAELVGAGVDAKRRVYLLYLDQHPPGTLVESPERTICRVPCTLVLPVEEATLVRFSHPGYVDSLFMARPNDHLSAMFPIQPLRRLAAGATYEPTPFPAL